MAYFRILLLLGSILFNLWLETECLPENLDEEPLTPTIPGYPIPQYDHIKKSQEVNERSWNEPQIEIYNQRPELYAHAERRHPEYFTQGLINSDNDQYNTDFDVFTSPEEQKTYSSEYVYDPKNLDENVFKPHGITRDYYGHREGHGQRGNHKPDGSKKLHHFIEENADSDLDEKPEFVISSIKPYLLPFDTKGEYMPESVPYFNSNVRKKVKNSLSDILGLNSYGYQKDGSPCLHPKSEFNKIKPHIGICFLLIKYNSQVPNIKLHRPFDMCEDVYLNFKVEPIIGSTVSENIYGMPIHDNIYQQSRLEHALGFEKYMQYMENNFLQNQNPSTPRNDRYTELSIENNEQSLKDNYIPHTNNIIRYPPKKIKTKYDIFRQKYPYADFNYDLLEEFEKDANKNNGITPNFQHNPDFSSSEIGNDSNQINNISNGNNLSEQRLEQQPQTNINLNKTNYIDENYQDGVTRSEYPPSSENLRSVKLPDTASPNITFYTNKTNIDTPNNLPNTPKEISGKDLTREEMKPANMSNSNLSSDSNVNSSSTNNQPEQLETNLKKEIEAPEIQLNNNTDVNLNKKRRMNLSEVTLDGLLGDKNGQKQDFRAKKKKKSKSGWWNNDSDSISDSSSSSESDESFKRPSRGKAQKKKAPNIDHPTINQKKSGRPSYGSEHSEYELEKHTPPRITQTNLHQKGNERPSYGHAGYGFEQKGAPKMTHINTHQMGNGRPSYGSGYAGNGFGKQRAPKITHTSTHQMGNTQSSHGSGDSGYGYQENKSPESIQKNIYQIENGRPPNGGGKPKHYQIHQQNIHKEITEDSDEELRAALKDMHLEKKNSYKLGEYIKKLTNSVIAKSYEKALSGMIKKQLKSSNYNSCNDEKTNAASDYRYGGSVLNPSNVISIPSTATIIINPYHGGHPRDVHESQPQYIGVY